MPQYEIKMSVPLRHRLNIKDNNEIYMAGWRVEQNAELPTPPVTHNKGPVDPPGTFGDQINHRDPSN